MVRDHTSLIAWREARSVTLSVYRLGRSRWKPYARAIFDQLQRASLSVQLNIAEGYALANTPSLRRHLTIAYASAVETQELLELAVEVELLPGEEIAATLQRCKRSQRLLLGLIKRPAGRP